MLRAMRNRWSRIVTLVLVAGLAGCGSRDAGPTAAQPAAPPAADSAARSGPTPPALRLDGSVVPREYAVDLTLDPARDDFRGAVTIAVEVKQPTRLVWLHGRRLDVTRAVVTSAAGAELTAVASAHGEFLALGLPQVVSAGPAIIRIEYSGVVPTTDTEGLFRQSEGGHTYIYTQFEPTGARMAFPCFDEPSFKVPWQVTVHVPAGLVALSNTPVVSQTPAGDIQTVVFGKTRPLPSYLVALAVGPFDLVDLGRAGRNRTPMRIAVPKGRAGEARYARKVTGELLSGMEEYFDIPYPYEKLDSVAVPTFLGAMENPGLITYSASLLLARPNEETPQFKQSYARIAAHEIAHHWFGDLVTMAWWDDIWLNESFATFMADRVVGDWQKSWGIEVGRVKGAEQAFATDSLVSARKVHHPIAKHDDIVATFDTISYQKGGALLDMFEAWIGRPSFQRAIHAYLEAHRWGNATSKDFIAALAAESRPEVAAAFETFIEQSGIPLVSLAVECPPGGSPELALGQERFLPIGSKGSAEAIWSVPMCVGFARGKKSAVQCFLLSSKTQRVALDTRSCPAWVDGNAGGHGYYRVAYAGDLGTRLLDQGALDTAGRVSALFNLNAMVDAGRTRMGELLAIMPAVTRDRDPEITGVALDLARGIEPLVSPELLPSYARFLARSFAGPARAIGWKPRRGESSQTSKLRPWLLRVAGLRGEDPKLVAGARAVARRYLANPRSLDPRIGGVALAAVARAGEDPALFDRLEAAFEKTEDHRFRSALLAGMVMSRDPAQRDRTLARLGSGQLTLEELFALSFAAMGDPTTRDPAWAYLVAHLDEVAAALPFLLRPGVVRFAGFFCDAEHRKTVDTVFRAKLQAMPGGIKALNEVLEGLDLCIARREKFGADIAAFLGSQ
jgi:alanyl aminopeptidase